jgi:hypothetical protein
MLAAMLLLALDFRAELKAAGAIYDKVGPQTAQALVEADLGAAQKLFLDAVPESERAAAHWFVLGNLWFDMDPEFAYRMHSKAFELAPTENDVIREWAVELHRAGKWSEAEPLYAKLVGGVGEPVYVARALRADCLLRMGKPAEAAASWQAAQKTKRKEQMLDAFEWVYGVEHPIHKRARLLVEIKAGKLEQAEELILTDVFWQPEDERYFLNYDYMQADSKIVFEKLGRESRRAKDLWAVMNYSFIDWEQQFPREDGAKPHEILEQSARELSWIGDKPMLPENARVARVMIAALVDQKLRTAPQLLGDFGATLEQRAKASPADDAAAQTLIWLAEQAQSPKLAEYRQLAKPDARAAKRAVVDSARKRGQPLTEPLAQQLMAELASPERDAATLDQLFGDLGTAAGAKDK